MSVLDTSSQGVDVILHDVALVETMVLEPATQEHTVTTAYLLAWNLVLAAFRAAKSEVCVMDALCGVSLAHTLLPNIAQ